MSLNQAVDGYERDLIHRALFQSKGNVSEGGQGAVRPRQTLQRRSSSTGWIRRHFRGSPAARGWKRRKRKRV